MTRIIGALCLLVVPCVSLFVLKPSEGFCEFNLTKVRIGMAEKEVKHVLCAVEGDYSGEVGLLVMPENAKVLEGPSKDWLGKEKGIRIWFDSENRVRFFILGDVAQLVLNGNVNQDSFFDKLLQTGKQLLKGEKN